jgi:glycosyltransferase involved in cell wall biosynthesis
MFGTNPIKKTSPPIRILHIVRNLSVGGMEGRVARLARGLNQNLFQISIMGLRPLEGRQVDLPKHVPYLTESIEPGLHFKALWKLSRRIRDGKYDVVHTHNWPTMFYGILAAKLAGVPIIFHGEHGLESAKNIPRKRLFAQKILAALTQHIVAVNASIGKVVLREWSLQKNKVTVLPNGADVERFQPNTNKESQEFVIGTVGRQVPVKDLPCLIRGFAHFLSLLANQENSSAVKPLSLIHI